MQRPQPKVFVSSTWLDLQSERKAVEKAIRRMRDYDFNGMEYFGSRDDTPREVSLAEVDRSDVYVGIFAARYGSGITEEEYRRARERGLTCRIYFKAEASITLNKVEKGRAKQARLKKLKAELLQAHTITEFTSPEDLAGKVLADLHRWLAEEYQPQPTAATPAETTAALAAQIKSLKVFLCHASDDKAEVRALYHRLRTNGIEPWLDEENLLPGQVWEPTIRKAVRSSHVVIVCLSPNSVSKTGFIQKEIRIALDAADEQPEGAIFLIPLKLKECVVPERLHRYHWVNYYEERGYERLMNALRERAKSLGL